MKRSERLAQQSAWVAFQSTILFIVVAGAMIIALTIGIDAGWWAVLVAASVSMPAFERVAEALRLAKLARAERIWEGGAR